jgi:hypothetical protein
MSRPPHHASEKVDWKSLIANGHFLSAEALGTAEIAGKYLKMRKAVKSVVLSDSVLFCAE